MSIGENILLWFVLHVGAMSNIVIVLEQLLVNNFLIKTSNLDQIFYF